MLGSPWEGETEHISWVDWEQVGMGTRGIRCEREEQLEKEVIWGMR